MDYASFQHREGKLAKTSCHCWHKHRKGRCHYRNIRVKDTASEKKLLCALSKSLDGVQMRGMRIHFGVIALRLFKVCCAPPTLAVVGGNAEIYE